MIDVKRYIINSNGYYGDSECTICGRNLDCMSNGTNFYVVKNMYDDDVIFCETCFKALQFNVDTKTGNVDIYSKVKKSTDYSNIYTLPIFKTISYNHFLVADNNENVIADIHFQNQSISDGVNGCFMEDLIHICILRLKQFQNTEFKCDDNFNAIHHLEKAIEHLNNRTKDRKERGVLGKYEK